MGREFLVDRRFINGEDIDWQHGTQQALQRWELQRIPCSTKSDSKYEFLMPSTYPVGFSPVTGMLVQGVFECREAPTPANKDPVWDKVAAGDYSGVIVQPNWFEHYVQSVDVIHENSPVVTHNCPPNLDPFLNTYIYSMMDELIKKSLCPEACHPGNGVPTKSGTAGWDHTEGSEWHTYSKEIFDKATVMFRYVPMFTFPFFQDPTYCSANDPMSLPTPSLKNLKVNVRMDPNTSKLFKKATNNTKQYRFRLLDMEMVVFGAQLNSLFEKSYLGNKKMLFYPGVTKLGLTQNFNAGVSTARVRLQDIPYPEALLIVAMSNKYAGDFKYSEVADTKGKMFLYHNIEKLDLKFENMALSATSPNLGDINNHLMEIKQLHDYMREPPFGIHQDPKKIKLGDIKDGNKQSLFPHVYISLCPSGKKSRTIPMSSDGQVINKNGDLTMEIKFHTDGPAADSVYAFYAIYTDVNMKLDTKNKTFTPMYNAKTTL